MLLCLLCGLSCNFSLHFQAFLVSGASDGLLILWSADHIHDSRELVPKLSLKVTRLLFLFPFLLVVVLFKKETFVAFIWFIFLDLSLCFLPVEGYVFILYLNYNGTNIV